MEKLTFKLLFFREEYDVEYQDKLAEYEEELKEWKKEAKRRVNSTVLQTNVAFAYKLNRFTVF